MSSLRRAIVSGLLGCAMTGAACAETVFAVDPSDGGDGGSGEDASLADAASDACTHELGCAPCVVVYVAANGNDTNDGCTPKTPKGSIGSALGVVRGGSYNVKDIRVCRGTYAENELKIDRPVNVRGGYECDTWKRTVIDRGLVAGNVTIVKNASYNVSAVTLQVAMPLVVGSPQPVIEGLTVYGGPATGTQGSSGAKAVVLTSGAPLIRWNHFNGGEATNAAGDGSIGMEITSTDGPEVTQNLIEGATGSATSTSFGVVQIASAGLVIRPAAGGAREAPLVHDNELAGGTGTVASGFGSVGLWLGAGVSFRGPRAVRGNTLRGGLATNTSKSPPSGVRDCGSSGVVLVENTNVELLGNTILAGTGTVDASNADTRYATGALFVRSPTFLRADGNRIYAGDVSALNRGRGILVLSSNGGAVDLTNNFIHGGQRDLPSGGNTAAIALASYGFGGSTLVRNNTIVVARATGYSTSVGIEVGDDFGSSRGAVVQNNLMVGSGTASLSQQVGVSLRQCPSTGPIAAFTSNLFVNVVRAGGTNLLTVVPTACTNVTSSVDVLESILSASGEAHGNARFEPPACGADTRCVPTTTCSVDAGGGACLEGLFESPGAGNPYGAIFGDGGTDGGLLLRAATSCTATQGARDLSKSGGKLDAAPDAVPFAPVTTDFFGSPRTGDGGTGMSFGAHEQNAPGCAVP